MKNYNLFLGIGIILFLTNSVFAAYCSSSGTTSSWDSITMVALNTGNQTSTADSYTDYTSSTFTSLTAGQTYTINVAGYISGSVGSDYVRVWMDFNQDQDFTDSGEQFDIAFYPTNVNQVHTFTNSITIPSGAANGNTRMRVTNKWNNYSSPCESISYGEVEDYTVNIVGATTTTTTTSSTTTTTITPYATCNDSDGGIQYNTYGSVAFYSITQNGFVASGTNYDSCNGDTLTEGYCSGTTPQETQYTCPGGCTSGACIPTTTSTTTTTTTTTSSTTTTTITPYSTCNDSDGGIQYNTYGSVAFYAITQSGLVSAGTNYDTCNGNTLTEGYCSGTTPQETQYTCPGGCTSGACTATTTSTTTTTTTTSSTTTTTITPYATCNDSDGGIQYNTYGSVVFYAITQSGLVSAGTNYDSCNGNTLTEGYCSGTTPQETQYTCTSGCTSGACTATTTTTTTTTSTTTTTLSTGSKVSVVRDLPDSASNASTLHVYISVNVNESNQPGALGITEFFPLNWVVSNISSGGINQGNRIEWLCWASSQCQINDQNLSYYIKVNAPILPSNATFNGTTDDSAYNYTTAGDTKILVIAGCTLTGDNPPCGTVSLSEVVSHISKWSSGQTSLSSVVSLINAWSQAGG